MADVKLPGRSIFDTGSADAISKALGVAGQVFQIKGALQKQKQLSEQLDREQQGVLTKQEQVAARLSPVPEGTEGAIELGIQGPGGVERGLFKRQKEVSPLQQMATAFGLQAKQAAEQRAERKEQREIQKQQITLEKADRDREKEAQRLARRKIPGFDLREGAAPDEQEVRKLKDLTADQQTVLGTIEDLQAFLADGGVDIAGPRAERMSSLTSELQLKMKDIYALGVLSKSDEKFLKDIVPDTAGVAAFLKNFAGLSDPSRVLEDLKGRLNRSVNNAAIKKGYQPRQRSQEVLDSGGTGGGIMTPQQRQRLEELRRKHGRQ